MKVGSSQVFASDPDSGLNGLLEYSVIAGNHGEMFWIDGQRGVIMTNAVLDYEACSSYRCVQHSVSCLVSASIGTGGMALCCVSLIIKHVFPLLQLKIVI